AAIGQIFAFAHPSNPFDMTGEVVGKPQLLAAELEVLSRHTSATHVLVATATFHDEMAERIYSELPHAIRRLETPVFTTYWPVAGLTDKQEALLHESGAPVIANSARAVRALARWHQMGPWPETTDTRGSGIGSPPTARTYGQLRAELVEW